MQSTNKISWVWAYRSVCSKGSVVMRLSIFFICLLSFNSCIWASDYILGSGDEIKVTVYNEPDLTSRVKIDKSGTISFPFIGDIQVIGLSTQALETKIRIGLLGDYLINPQVDVSIVTHRPFFIHGQVKRPGGYPYQEGITLDKAIAIAGGLASRASNTNWILTRVVDGKKVIIEANVATRVNPDDIIKIEQSFF